MWLCSADSHVQVRLDLAGSQVQATSSVLSCYRMQPCSADSPVQMGLKAVLGQAPRHNCCLPARCKTNIIGLHPAGYNVRVLHEVALGKLPQCEPCFALSWPGSLHVWSASEAAASLCALWIVCQEARHPPSVLSSDYLAPNGALQQSHAQQRPWYFCSP